MIDVNKYKYTITLNLKTNQDFDYSDPYRDHQILYVEDMDTAYRILSNRLSIIKRSIKMVDGIEYMGDTVKRMINASSKDLMDWSADGYLEKYDSYEDRTNAEDYEIHIAIEPIKPNMLKKSFISA